MFPPHKGSVAIMLGGHPSDDDEDDDAPESGKGEVDKHALTAMQEFISAVHDKDAKAAYEAFCDLKDLHDEKKASQKSKPPADDEDDDAY